MDDTFEQEGGMDETSGPEKEEVELKDSDIFSEDDTTDADLKKLRDQVLLDLFETEEVIERLEEIKALEKNRALEIVAYNRRYIFESDDTFDNKDETGSFIALDKALAAFNIPIPYKLPPKWDHWWKWDLWTGVVDAALMIRTDRDNFSEKFNKDFFSKRDEYALYILPKIFPVTYYLAESPGRLKELIDSGEIDINSYGGAFGTDVIPPKK